MRDRKSLETRSYLFSNSLWINAVNLGTLGGIADSLENRCLPCICSSNNEDSELDVGGESGEILLCSHGVDSECRGGSKWDCWNWYVPLLAAVDGNHFWTCRTYKHGTNTSWLHDLHDNGLIRPAWGSLEVRHRAVWWVFPSIYGDKGLGITSLFSYSSPTSEISEGFAGESSANRCSCREEYGWTLSINLVVANHPRGTLMDDAKLGRMERACWRGCGKRKGTLIINGDGRVGSVRFLKVLGGFKVDHYVDH
jgi:hypothetical protein